MARMAAAVTMAARKKLGRLINCIITIWLRTPGGSNGSYSQKPAALVMPDPIFDGWGMRKALPATLAGLLSRHMAPKAVRVCRAIRLRVKITAEPGLENIGLPAECDVSIRPGWFWHEAENSKVKTPKGLI